MNETGEGAKHSTDWLVPAAGFGLSLAILWLLTRDPVLTAGFAGGALALGGLAFALFRRRPPPPEPEWALPDWSVTFAAIDDGAETAAIAITDRAGRLVCANSLYERWFGAGVAPPRLPLAPASLDRLARAARDGWREGTGRAEALDALRDEGNTAPRRPGTPLRWRAEARRAGRGDDFLVWRIAALTVLDPVTEVVRALDGKLGRALAASGIVAVIVDPDGRIRAASAGFAQRATGDAGAALVGQDFAQLLTQDESEQVSWARDGGRGSPLTLYYIPVADPDSPAELDYANTPSLMLVMDHAIGIGSAQGPESASVAHLEALLGQLPLGLAMADRDGRLLFANAAFLRAAGLEAGDTPLYPSDLVVREDKTALSDAVRRHAQGPAVSGDIAIRLRDRADEPVSLSLAGVRGLGEAAVLLGLTDSTEEERLKRQVAQATKMQAVGQLAGGVAHDFNNVLTAILGTCDLMLLRHTPGDSDYDDIQQIRANSNRAASLTRQLLAFSRQQTLRPEVLQLPDIVSDISQMLKRLIGVKIELSVKHDRDLGPVRADPTQLEQVIVNLVVNARDAIIAKGEVSGRLTLATRRVTAADVRALHAEFMPQGDYTALIVEDTGAGIAPDHLSKIFEPFFTTKEQGRGTGLGLSTVYGIVKQSGGFIFADSELGKGTRFSVYLPVHHGPVEAKAIAAEEQRHWAGGGRILLVEDEDAVRAVAERALLRQGYEVTCAEDGETGLARLRASLDGGERFDLVVSDVVMPGLDGPAMAREIRKAAPDLPVLFMSGYAEEQLRREIDLPDMHFIPKPFSVRQITDKVASVLALAR